MVNPPHNIILREDLINHMVNYSHKVELQDMQAEEMSRSEKAVAKIQEKVLSTTIKEVTPFGVKLELNLAGRITGELYSAQHMETVSLFQKTDGTFESEARAIETTNEGDVFVIQYKGTGKATGATTMWGESTGVIMTQSKKFAQLNNARLRAEVNADIATGDVQVSLLHVGVSLLRRLKM